MKKKETSLSCYQDLATTYSEDAEGQKGPSSYTAWPLTINKNQKNYYCT